MLTSKRIAASVSALAVMAVAAGCGGSSSKDTVDLIAYSTPQAVYAKLIPAFQATSAGKGAKFNQSYGPSGTQSKAVIAGQPADVVEFSREPDMDKLVAAKLVAAELERQPVQGHDHQLGRDVHGP